MSQHISSSAAIRLNVRGMFSYHQGTDVRDLQGIGWYAKPCNLSAWALCSTETGDVFPAARPRMPQNPSSLSPGWRSLSCSDSSQKILIDTGSYDITACDVLDEGLDIVYARGMVYIRKTSIQGWMYWTLVALAIILVRALSYNIQYLWFKDSSPKDQWPVVACTIVMLVLVLSDLDSLYVTYNDQVIFW